MKEVAQFILIVWFLFFRYQVFTFLLDMFRRTFRPPQKFHLGGDVSLLSADVSEAWPPCNFLQDDHALADVPLPQDVASCVRQLECPLIPVHHPQASPPDFDRFHYPLMFSFGADDWIRFAHTINAMLSTKSYVYHAIKLRLGRLEGLSTYEKRNIKKNVRSRQKNDKWAITDKEQQ